MAKEQLHSWSRTIVTIISLVFVCGITYKTIDGNTGDIETNATDIKAHEDKVDKVIEDVHKIELEAKDIKNVAVQSAEAFTDIKVTLTEMQKTQAEQATVQAVMSAKLETLTKD